MARVCNLPLSLSTDTLFFDSMRPASLRESRSLGVLAPLKYLGEQSPNLSAPRRERDCQLPVYLHLLPLEANNIATANISETRRPWLDQTGGGGCSRVNQLS